MGTDPPGRLGITGRHGRRLGPGHRRCHRRPRLVQYQLHGSARPGNERLRLECSAASHVADSVNGVSLRYEHGGLAAAAAGSQLDHRAEGLMLAAQDLVLDYRRGTAIAHAVDTVSLRVERGSFVGLIGPSGSGKSSLMYLLSGLKRPTGGAVTFDGHDYSELSAARLIRLRRQHFGFVFQQHFLVNYLSAIENVTVGGLRRNHDTAAYAQELLRRVGLGDKLQKRPSQLWIGGW